MNAMTPEDTYEQYRNGGVTNNELFGELIECSKSYPVERILNAVKGQLYDDFKDYLMEFESVKDDSEIGSLHGTLRWGIADVRKFLRFFEAH